MTDVHVTKEDIDARHGRYVAHVQGIEAEAELTFTRRGYDRISADHTGAPDALRGTGAAAALVAYMVEDARLAGIRVIPLCPYVRAQYLRHPDWADVFTTAPGEEPVTG